MSKSAGGYGYHTYPEGVRAVYGARMIWPDDLLPDRQGVDKLDQEAADELLAWLNDGAGNAMRSEARRLADTELSGSEEREVVLYEDDRGRVVGNPNASYGYFYVAAWLFAHEKTVA